MTHETQPLNFVITSMHMICGDANEQQSSIASWSLALIDTLSLLELEFGWHSLKLSLCLALWKVWQVIVLWGNSDQPSRKENAHVCMYCVHACVCEEGGKEDDVVERYSAKARLASLPWYQCRFGCSSCWWGQTHCITPIQACGLDKCWDEAVPPASQLRQNSVSTNILKLGRSWAQTDWK